MIGENDLDLLAVDRPAGILGRQTGRDHRTLPGQIGIHARLIVQHADLDGIAASLGVGASEAEHGRQCGPEHDAHKDVSRFV